MKRIVTVFIAIALLAGLAPAFAAVVKKAAATAEKPAATAKVENPVVVVPVEKSVGPAKTPFNMVASYLSGFDRAYARRGNKQSYCNAAADWLKNINKQ